MLETNQVFKLSESEALLHSSTEFDHARHQCYVIELKDCYVLLVYGNGRLMHYEYSYFYPFSEAESLDELTDLYKKWCNDKLFRLADCTNASNYSDYRNKCDYLRDIYPKKWDSVSIFQIGSEKAEHKEEYKYLSHVCFHWFREEEVVDWLQCTKDKLEKSWHNKLMKDKDLFRQALKYELWDYEVCISYDYSDAIKSLGFTEDNLTDWQQAILQEEFRKVCYD